MAQDKKSDSGSKRITSPSGALKAAGMPNSTANQVRAKKAISRMMMEGMGQNVSNFKKMMKRMRDE